MNRWRGRDTYYTSPTAVATEVHEKTPRCWSQLSSGYRSKAITRWAFSPVAGSSYRYPWYNDAHALLLWPSRCWENRDEVGIFNCIYNPCLFNTNNGVYNSIAISLLIIYSNCHLSNMARWVLPSYIATIETRQARRQSTFQAASFSSSYFQSYQMKYMND